AAPAATAPPAPTAAAQAAPQPDPAEDARRQDMLDALAAMLEREKRYPLAARRGGLSGRVLLLVQFDAQGRPAAWQVLEGDAPEVLCRAALEAMERASRRLAEGLPLLAGRRVRVPVRYQLE
ncbi:MAG: TonB family protein, partial [Pseudomonadota bacterium]